jgi:hypothetical protein
MNPECRRVACGQIKSFPFCTLCFLPAKCFEASFTLLTFNGRCLIFGSHFTMPAFYLPSHCLPTVCTTNCQSDGCSIGCSHFAFISNAALSDFLRDTKHHFTWSSWVWLISNCFFFSFIITNNCGPSGSLHMRTSQEALVHLEDATAQNLGSHACAACVPIVGQSATKHFSLHALGAYSIPTHC